MSYVSCSILIHTKNEAENLQECLNTLKWSDDINILDSYSTDKTKEIALKNSCNFILRSNYDKSKPFGGSESEHRNWALRNIEFKYQWLFVIDADERCTESCYQNIKKVINIQNNPFVAYRFKRRDFFQNKYLKYTQLTPWYIRLYKPQYVTFSRSINVVTEVNGKVGSSRGFIDHYPFQKGLSHWVERHNSYSSFEAKEYIKLKSQKISLKLIKTILFESEFEIRRKAQKVLFYKLPFRIFIKFFVTYIVRKGFLDGRAGFNYAMLQFFYEFLIILKQKEQD